MKNIQDTLTSKLPLFFFASKRLKTEDEIPQNAYIPSDMMEKLLDYNLESYINDIHTLGLSKTWDIICAYILQFGEKGEFLTIPKFGELYEIGLEIQDKIQKKASGQYYTPDDVADIMGKWLHSCKGDNICDVGCGTGKLILTYLDYIGYENAVRLIQSGHLYLYDSDKTALKICKTSILIKYTIDNPDCIHDICGDFLSDDIKLPKKSKVISNPPYAAIKEFDASWKQTDVLLTTKELYAAFMEKIFAQSESSVVITPFSFISGNKFFSLRKRMSDQGNGFIIAFDNVPGNIFCGRKHGIFNTNTANSVRAAITIFHSSGEKRGFRVSPLIRFKNEERSKLLVNDVLENLLPENIQTIDNINTTFKKINRYLEDIFYTWEKNSKYKVSDIISKEKTEYLIDMPNTCRYFTTGSHRKLKRSGSITIHVKEKKYFNFLYCFINSSFTYWWWRIFDGGITFPKSLLMSMPLPLNLLSNDDEVFFEEVCNEMIQVEANYIVTKLNAGEPQENIKFPQKYNKKINDKILSILGFKDTSEIFIPIHSNNFLGKIDDEYDTR